MMLSPIEESKPAMCVSPQEKLAQRNKRSHAAGALTAASDAKKARLDDMFKNEFELDLDGWISDDYLRAMDFDDRLNQDIDWVVHDEVDLSLSMDDHSTSDDVNDFGFGPSFLRGGLTFEDPAEMASTFVDPAYIRLESSNTKDAEKLLMSFDTMNFKIPSPTCTSSKKRSSIFSEKDAKQADAKTAAATDASATSSSAQVAANSAAAEELRKEQARVSAASSATASLSISAPTDSLLSVLNVGSPTSNSTEKKIGSYSPAARKLRLQKFHEKRKNRTWKKSIKYDCRKKLADDRPRIKGRFVRVLENAGDSKPATASRSPSSPPSCASAGYASPTSPTGAMAPPMMAPKAVVPRVASCASTLASGVKQTSASSVTKPSPVAAPATSAAALPFARMIASV
ncbi:hypothetical protein PRIC1_002104 [Phytophthora ramorum]